MKERVKKKVKELLMKSESKESFLEECKREFGLSEDDFSVVWEPGYRNMFVYIGGKPVFVEVKVDIKNGLIECSKG